MGEKRSRPQLCQVDSETTFEVPEFFRLDFAELANVQPKKTYQYSAPHECDSPLMMEHERFTKSSLEEERKWLECAAEVVQAIQEPEDITITNVVYHSRQENAVEPHEHLTISALLPVQFEVAHTFEMMKHCVDLIKAAKDVLNPSQKTTVDVSDMPLYALSKQIQFAIPDQYGLQLYLPLMGDLHTEQASNYLRIIIIIFRFWYHRSRSNCSKICQK